MLNDENKLSILFNCSSVSFILDSFLIFKYEIIYKETKNEIDEPGLVKLSLESSSIAGGGYYETIVDGEEFSVVWLCPVTLFVLGRYPKYIYFRRVVK